MSTDWIHVRAPSTMGLLRRSPRLLAKESARQTPRSSPRLQAKASASQNAPAIASRPTAARKACHQAPSKPGRGGGRRRFGETKVPGVWAGGTCHLIRRDIRKIVKGKIGLSRFAVYWFLAEVLSNDYSQSMPAAATPPQPCIGTRPGSISVFMSSDNWT